MTTPTEPEIPGSNTLSPKLDEVIDALARSRAALLDAVRGLSQAQLDRRPAAGTWSPGEILDHVFRAERGTARLAATRVPAALDAGLPLDPAPDASVMHRLDDARVTDRSRRIAAPEFVVPAPGRGRDELLAGLEEARTALLDAVRPASRYDLSAIVHPHPILGPLDLYQWLLFCHHHERRHTEQIREALGQVRGSGSV
jgi:hypothetical protein